METVTTGCVDALLKKGMKIPEDIGVIAFDDYPFSRTMERHSAIHGKRK